MERRTSNLECDEFEKLLCEIPNVTSGNLHIGESSPVDALSSLGTVSDEEMKRTFGSNKFCNIYSSPQAPSHRDSGALSSALALPRKSWNQKYDSSNNEGSPKTTADQNAPNLPDNQSLAIAFDELSFKDGIASIPATAFLENTPTQQILKNIGGDGRESWLSFPEYLCASPLSPVARNSGIYACGFNLPAPTFQQQYYMETKLPSCVPYQQLRQSNIAWWDIDHKRNYSRQSQLLYVQQLQNQDFEELVHRSRSSAVEHLSGDNTKTYLEMPSFHQAGQVSLSSDWNGTTFNRQQLHPSVLGRGYDRCQTNEHCGMYEGIAFPLGKKLSSSNNIPTKTSPQQQILDKVGKHFFPEKILTRSQGVNSIRTLVPGCIESSQLPENFGINQGLFSSGKGHDHPTQVDQSFHLNGESSYSPNAKLTSVSPPLEYNPIDDVKGQVYFLAKDQQGCRLLQRIFTEGTPEDVEKIFSEIIDHVIELMIDPFGNYLIQKLLDVCGVDKMSQIVQEITQTSCELLQISCNQYGTRVVQKVIETIKAPEQHSLIASALKPGIEILIKDTNGNHVAQRCLQFLSPEYREFLFEAAVVNCIELAKDRQGCCVLQKCLSNLEGKQRLLLMSKITSKAYDLSQDPYGNYVVQFILEQQNPWAITEILDQLEGHYHSLSLQKCSSHVVEKCLKYAGNEGRAKIVEQLINDPRFLQIMQDQFGNFVIQSALKECQGALRDAFVEAIRPHVPALRASPYGKRVLSSISLKK